jgi:hypothetical protein
MRLESLTLPSIRAQAVLLKLKKLVTLNGGHFDAYGQDFDIASRSPAGQAVALQKAGQHFKRVPQQARVSPFLAAIL